MRAWLGRRIMDVGHVLAWAFTWHELRCGAYGERSRLTEIACAIWSYGLRLHLNHDRS